MSRTKVHINPLSLFPVVVLLLYNPPEYVGIMLFCALLHEAGHLTAMKICGVGLESIDVMLLGARIKMSGLCTYGEDMLIYASGALINLAGAVISYAVYFYNPSTEVMFLMLSNLFYAFFNMLPIRGLDGGGFIEAVLLNYTTPDTAWHICERVSEVFMALLLFFSLWIIYVSGTNFSLLFIVFYLFIGLREK